MDSWPACFHQSLFVVPSDTIKVKTNASLTKFNIFKCLALSDHCLINKALLIIHTNWGKPVIIHHVDTTRCVATFGCTYELRVLIIMLQRRSYYRFILVQLECRGSENTHLKWKADLRTSKLAITERLKAPFHPIPILQTLINSAHDFFNNHKQKLYKKIKSACRSWNQGKWEEGTKIISHHQHSSLEAF